MKHTKMIIKLIIDLLLLGCLLQVTHKFLIGYWAQVFVTALVWFFVERCYLYTGRIKKDKQTGQ